MSKKVLTVFVCQVFIFQLILKKIFLYVPHKIVFIKYANSFLWLFTVS
jgi:hypothetical protein